MAQGQEPGESAWCDCVSIKSSNSMTRPENFGDGAVPFLPKQHTGAALETHTFVEDPRDLQQDSYQPSDEVHHNVERHKTNMKKRKYSISVHGRSRLVPAVGNCRKALFAHCNLTPECCESLASVLSSDSPLRKLDVSNNDLQDSGVELLSAGLKSSLCKLQILRIALCNLTEKSVEILASVLQSASSVLRELDLSNNDLDDLGVKLFAAGLESTHCKLEVLRLSGCMITEEGCSLLASVLKSNPSHLKELDLSYNHPGETGEKLLYARLADPHCKLETLNLEHGEECRIKPGLNKYTCELRVDRNSAHTELTLNEGKGNVTCGDELH
ncbi:hypothetical protein MHYP_G00105180 [Metynnis hypsauchen]